MTTMTEFTVTNTAWLEVASGATHVTLQLRSTYDLDVHVGQAQPSPTADPVCFKMSGNDDFWSLQPLDSAADRVFVRAVNQDVNLVVMAGQ